MNVISEMKDRIIGDLYVRRR